MRNEAHRSEKVRVSWDEIRFDFAPVRFRDRLLIFGFAFCWGWRALEWRKHTKELINWYVWKAGNR